MNSATKFFLILLRVAIGWHLLFAGLAKFEPGYKGSEGYLQNSWGPAAPLFHHMTGDRLADELAVTPLPAGADPVPMHQRFPPALAAEWSDYFNAFAEHYHFTPEQHKDALEKMEQVEDKTGEWLDKGELTIEKTSPYGPPAKVTKTVPEWVKEYQATRQKLRDESANAYHFGVSAAPLADNTRDQSADRAEVAKIRSELTKKLDDYKLQMKDSLRTVLTDEQKAQPALADPVKPTWGHMTHLDWIDFLVRWGLVLSGAGLILGLLTRLDCIVGALLLLSFYLAVLPLPGLPEAFHAEGYPYISKNIVEMLALLTLATTRSGRWAGLDALLYYLNPFRRKTPEPRPIVPGKIETFAPYQVTTTDAARTAPRPHAQK